MKILLIDDEPTSLDAMEGSINELENANLEVVGRFSILDEAELYIKNNPVDLIFLDICFENEKTNIEDAGFLFLERFDKITFGIIFITGNDTDSNRLKAAELSSCGFIKKPARTKRYASAIINYMQRQIYEKEHLFTNTKLQIETLLDNLKNLKDIKSQKITIDIRKDNMGNSLESPETIILKIGDILYLESCTITIKGKNQPRTKFVCIDGSTHLSTKSLNEYNSLLSSYSFIKIRRGSTVNMDYISKYDIEKVTLKNDIEIPIGSDVFERVKLAEFTKNN